MAIVDGDGDGNGNGNDGDEMAPLTQTQISCFSHKGVCCIMALTISSLKANFPNIDPIADPRAETKLNNIG